MDHRLLAWREIEVEFESDARPLVRRLAKRLARPALGRRGIRQSWPTRCRCRESGDRRAPRLRALTDICRRARSTPSSTATCSCGADRIRSTTPGWRSAGCAARFACSASCWTARQPSTSMRSSSGSPACSVRSATARCNAAASARSSPTGRPSIVLGPVANRINTDLHSEQLRARAVVAEAMDSPRYLDILATLQRWRRRAARHDDADRQKAAQAGEPGRTQGRPAPRRRGEVAR